MATSIYVKEDLPTWSEVYYEFYKNRVFSFDPTIEYQSDDIDKYWKIPRRKVLLTTVTNQFNKMLYEDGYSERFVTFLNNNITHNVVSAMFTCELITPPKELRTIDSYTQYMRDYDKWSSKYLDHFLKDRPIKEAPPIYTLSIPNGKPNPFITCDEDVDRINVDDLNGYLCIHPILFIEENDHKYAYCPTAFVPAQNVDWTKIIDWMMIPYIEYFENGVGWKDNNGNLIASDKVTTCVGSGFDPAL